MKKLIALLLALVMLFSLAGCSTGYTEEDLAAAKDAAYDEGFADGYAEFDSSHECEYTAEDIDAAYSKGYSDHESEYCRSDIDNAWQEGYDEGYDDGWDDADDYYGESSDSAVSSYATDDYATSYTTMVYIPRTGSKYHNNSACSGMKNPSYVSLDDAIAWGYTACKNCY